MSEIEADAALSAQVDELKQIALDSYILHEKQKERQRRAMAKLREKRRAEKLCKK